MVRVLNRVIIFLFWHRSNPHTHAHTFLSKSTISNDCKVDRQISLSSKKNNSVQTSFKKFFPPNINEQTLRKFDVSVEFSLELWSQSPSINRVDHTSRSIEELNQWLHCHLSKIQKTIPLRTLTSNSPRNIQKRVFETDSWLSLR